MYTFVYRILFEDGAIRLGGEEYLATLCKEQADKIAHIQRCEIYEADWLNVTAPTMRRILTRIEARKGK